MAARVSLSAVSAAGRAALRTLIDLAGPSRPVWLVGGAVRQLLAGEPVNDLDLATPREALALGRALADRLGGRFVALDRERGAGRVVGAGPGVPTIDLVDFRAPELDGDLRARDFTINALAAPLAALLRDGEAPVIDPTGGLADLRGRVVRLAGPGAIGDDPVRALRGARLATRPEWRLDRTRRPRSGPAPRAWPTSPRSGCATSWADPGRGARRRRACGCSIGWGCSRRCCPRARMRATPQPLPHRFDVWEHSLRAVEGGGRPARPTWTRSPRGVRARHHLDERLGGDSRDGRPSELAALLHDVAKPETRAGARWADPLLRPRRGGRAPRPAHRGAAAAAPAGEPVWSGWWREHLRPMHLAQAGAITRRARFRFFRDLGDDAPICCSWPWPTRRR